MPPMVDAITSNPPTSSSSVASFESRWAYMPVLGSDPCVGAVAMRVVVVVVGKAGAVDVVAGATVVVVPGAVVVVVVVAVDAVVDVVATVVDVVDVEVVEVEVDVDVVGDVEVVEGSTHLVVVVRGGCDVVVRGGCDVVVRGGCDVVVRGTRVVVVGQWFCAETWLNPGVAKPNQYAARSTAPTSRTLRTRIAETN